VGESSWHSEPNQLFPRVEKNQATGVMIRKNKETDPPAACIAPLTDRFDPSEGCLFKFSSGRFAFDGEREGIYRSEPRNGATTQAMPSSESRASVTMGRIMA